MLYDYICDCGNKFEVIKSMTEAARLEHCPKCSLVAKRIFTSPHITGAKVFEAQYFPSLGRIIHNNRELDNELKKRNLVCVGNDYGSGAKMMDTFEKNRKEEQEKAWEKTLEKIEL